MAIVGFIVLIAFSGTKHIERVDTFTFNQFGISRRVQHTIKARKGIYSKMEY